MTDPMPVVILSTADFESAVWTNKQHLAVRLLEKRPVTFVESLGLRRPTLTMADAARVVGRLRRTPPSSTSRRHEHARPTVISPLVIPLHGARVVRRLNQQLVDRSLRPRLPKHYLLWSFSPITYGLERHASAFVYHSVDLIHHQPHFPERTILSAERIAVRRADAVVASSIGVRDHLKSLGAATVHLWENVADTRLFATPRAARRPRAVFAGNLTPTKVDVAALQQVVEAGVDLIICGPLPTDGTLLPADVATLLAHPRVEYRGNRTPAELADLFAECQVGLIPYRINPYTQGVFPLKVYEYLAAGLTVVSTTLPSLANLPSTMLARAEPSQFGRLVAQEISVFDEQGADKRRAFASSHSWEARGEEADALIRELAKRRVTLRH